MQLRVSTHVRWITLLATIGCGGKPDAPPRYPVQGTVMLDGKPLPRGDIYFKQVSTGHIDTAPITDGRFEGQATAGERRVEFSVVGRRILTDVPGGRVEEAFEMLPFEFNVGSRYTATISSEGPNDFRFDLEKKR